MDRKTISDVIARRVEPIRPTVTNLDEYFDAQQEEINAEMALRRGSSLELQGVL